LYKTQEYSPLNSDKTLTKTQYRRIIYICQKLYQTILAKNLTPIQDKKDGYRKGKTKISDHPPPPLLGQNIGEKIYIYTLAKKIPNIWAKLEKLKPPHLSPKYTGQE
jgi:hypothetical protein